MGVYRDMEKRRAYMRAYQKKKYAEDAEHREKAKEAARKRGNEKYRNDPVHRAKCIEKVMKRTRENPEKRREYDKDYKRKNADRLREMAAQSKRDRYANDPIFREKMKQGSREWNATAENRIYRKIYNAARRSNDPQFRIRESICWRIRSALKSNRKSGSTLELLGCTIESLREHLESKFQPGMTWENYGYFGWHIDHRTPCASFDLTDPEQQRGCFNWKNLQPMWRAENQSKGASLPTNEMGSPAFPMPQATEEDADVSMVTLAQFNGMELWRGGDWMARSDAPNKLPFFISSSRMGAKASDKFHWRGRMSCESLNSPSAARSWFDPSIRASVERSALFEFDRRLALSNRKYIPQQFRPTAALAIYELFGGGKVYDPCGGWGDRMAAAIASPLVTNYHCRDVNPDVLLGYAEQKARYDHQNKVSFRLEQAENGGLAGMDFDLAFTSPPYFKIEKYPGALQSYALYPEFNQWMDGFLFRMAQTAWDGLRVGGHMVINIADCYADHKMNRICDPFVKWCVKNLGQCIFHGSLGYRIAVRINKSKALGPIVAEPILVFSKGPSNWADRLPAECR